MKEFKLSKLDVDNYNQRISPSMYDFVKINKNKIEQNIYQSPNIDNINIFLQIPVYNLAALSLTAALKNELKY